MVDKTWIDFKLKVDISHEKCYSKGEDGHIAPNF